MSDRFELVTADGISLEAKVDSPQRDPERITVFCHPHPEEGGTMNAPLMIGVTQALVARGHAVLRFNFRGTGQSEGAHGDGNAELADVSAAVEHARARDLPLGLAGWSFGAGVALNWLAEHEEVMPYVGIAPPPTRLPSALPKGPKRIILGTRDQVIDSEALIEYAKTNGIDLVLTPGDHFFHGRAQRIGALVAQGLADYPRTSGS
ncbi:MAG: alpha/beta hydrolase [Acidimicrobiia bacterium]